MAKTLHLTDKHRKPSQLEIWKELLKGHALVYPEFCLFVQLMMATSPNNTSDLEKAYSRLKMITTKYRTSEVSPPIQKWSSIFRRKQLALDCYFNFNSFLIFCCLSCSNIHWWHYIFMKWIDKSCKGLSGKSLFYITQVW